MKIRVLYSISHIFYAPSIIYNVDGYVLDLIFDGNPSWESVDYCWTIQNGDQKPIVMLFDDLISDADLHDGNQEPTEEELASYGTKIQTLLDKLHAIADVDATVEDAATRRQRTRKGEARGREEEQDGALDAVRLTMVRSNPNCRGERDGYRGGPRGGRPHISWLDLLCTDDGHATNT